MGFSLPNGSLPYPPPPPLNYTRTFIVFIGNINGDDDKGNILVHGDLSIVSRDPQIASGPHNQNIPFNIHVNTTISMYVYTQGINLEACMQIENIAGKNLTFSYCEIN